MSSGIARETVALLDSDAGSNSGDCIFDLSLKGLDFEVALHFCLVEW